MFAILNASRAHPSLKFCCLIPTPTNATALIALVTPHLRTAAWVFLSPVLYLYAVNESEIPC